MDLTGRAPVSHKNILKYKKIKPYKQIFISKMKTISLFLSSVFISLLALLLIGATVKQLIGPSAPTTTHALARWRSNNAYELTNGVIVEDDSGNLTGVGVITTTEVDSSTLYLTNGFTFFQKSNDLTAAQIGGTVGSVTNIAIINVNGALMKEWSDGTTLYKQEIGTH